MRLKHCEIRGTLAPAAAILVSHSSSDADQGWLDRERNRDSREGDDIMRFV